MAESSTPRFDLPRYTDPLVDTFSMDELDRISARVEDRGAIDRQGTLANRPAAGVRGTYYFATDGGGAGAGALFRDTGAGWRLLAEFDADGGHLVRRQFGDNTKLPADTPTTYPLGLSIVLADSAARPEWGAATGVAGSYLILTHRGNAAGSYVTQEAVKQDDGRTFVRMGNADGTGWTGFRELVRADGQDVSGNISVAPGHNLRGAVSLIHGMLAKPGTDGGDTYPFGTSAFVYGSGAAGWPEAFGTVLTHHYQSDFGRVFQEVLGTSGQRYTRRWNPGAPGSWTPFRTDPLGHFANEVVNAQTTSTTYVDTPSGPTFSFVAGPTGRTLVYVGGGLSNSTTIHTALAPVLTRDSDGVVTMSASDRYAIMHHGTQVERTTKLMQITLTPGASYTGKTQMRVGGASTGTVNEPQLGVVAL